MTATRKEGTMNRYADHWHTYLGSEQGEEVVIDGISIRFDREAYTRRDIEANGVPIGYTYAIARHGSYVEDHKGHEWQVGRDGSYEEILAALIAKVQEGGSR